MFSRRNFLRQILSGTLGLFAGYSVLLRSSEAGSRSNPEVFRENCSYLGDVRTKLYRKLVSGQVSADVSEKVTCPLCGQTMTITARDALAYCRSPAFSV